MNSRAGGEVFRVLEKADAMLARVRRLTEGSGPSPEQFAQQVALEELRAQTDLLAEACRHLEREVAKYRDLYDSAPDALVTTDARGVIVDANRPAAMLLGMPHRMLPGKLLIGFVARRDTIVFRDELRAILRGEGQGTFAVRVRARGGSPRVALLSVRTVRSTLRELRGGREPPAALHWTLRPDASRLLERKTVDDLLAAAADELGAPVTIERAQRMKALLEQFLGLAKDGQPAEAVSLREVVELARDRARPAALARGVVLSLERVDGDVRAYAVAGHLVWALDRLLALAIEASTTHGAVGIDLSTEEGHATVRVEASGALALGGRSLTLAVATEAVERHGGVLRVPELDQGHFVFELRLPLIPCRGGG
ncbi:MAG TPA: PAS domain S-box protein [Polyangiaceae bacterium]